MENGGDTADVESSSVFVTAPDGLKLHVRCYGSRLAPSLPVVCLPGLTRTTADFDALAAALAFSPEMPRRVHAGRQDRTRRRCRDAGSGARV